jgi:hypothetical protein
MSAGVWQRFLNNQSAVHLQTWYWRLSGNTYCNIPPHLLRLLHNFAILMTGICLFYTVLIRNSGKFTSRLQG